MNSRATPHDEGQLRADFEALARGTTRVSHPAEHEWVSFATGSLTASDRERFSDHLVSCAECTAVYRAVTHVRQEAYAFDAGAPRPTSSTTSLSSRALLPQALAASLLVVSAGLLAWNLRLQQRTVDLEAQVTRVARTTSPPVAETPAPVAPPQALALINVPIIDLQPPSRVRGAQSHSQVLTIPEGTELVTLIVNTDAPRRAGTYSLALIDSSGATTWSGGGLKPAPDGTLSVALPATLLRPGEYVFVLAEAPGGRTVHRYSITSATR